MGRARALPDPGSKSASTWRLPPLEQRVGSPQGIPARGDPAIDPTHDEAFFALEKLHTAAKRGEP